MLKNDDQCANLLEQIRNLLALQLLKSKIATNKEISRALGVSAGRSSQIFSKIIQKPKKQKGKNE